MDIYKLLNCLNKQQRTAVSAPRGHFLVLAGAGSGKTRVLVHRIAWLLDVEKCSEKSIMAVTFTTKASKEMRDRLDKLMGIPKENIWIGTFHSLSYRLLCSHYLQAGLPKNFQILDSDDQHRLLQRLMKCKNLDSKKWSISKIVGYINHKKEKGLRPKDITSYNSLTEKTWIGLYKIYQDVCDRSGLVDFSELLLRAYELLRDQSHIRDYYQKRFTNILVDEFQDTNDIQYKWIRILSGTCSKVVIVGDDDQSIYGWRGAQAENIQRFIQDFSGAVTIRLEQNYRSQNNILDAANALISYNNIRLGKQLWTEERNGDPISIYCALDELDEARFVVRSLQAWIEQGRLLGECVILYRVNIQAGVLEEILLEKNIPYQLHNGTHFFQRKEIKDLLSYLRLIVNRNDDAAFERVINTPLRRIGVHTLDCIRQVSSDYNITLWQSSQEILKQGGLIGNMASSYLEGFILLVDRLDKITKALPLDLQTQRILQDTGLWAMYRDKKQEMDQSRIAHLEEFINLAQKYSSSRHMHSKTTLLQDFLSDILIDMGEVNNSNKRKDAVQLMTLHASKGLEFSQVFIVGMEEGIFPSQASLDNGGGYLEEERRLAYVGITRAMQRLTLTHAKKRRLYGQEVSYMPSRFISELPDHCVKKISCNTRANWSFHNKNIEFPFINKESFFTVGQSVNHTKFGKGTIINVIGFGKDRRIQVEFYNQDIRWLFAVYARLSVQ
ncbi:DNA helicase II [Candidatus Erwinia haradaeae]|uniref:DNA 3'-5' helicase n=1 Tax=Candidatus Erwinia haradaeae TaxID=1922217 RepID=A0A451CYL7_9GAMM|nr:DNA helicase II [Candidatus Erwinia haradaeae]VFP78481.1 DNA helicase II [Candidatus Erwinia haradaeae]